MWGFFASQDWILCNPILSRALCYLPGSSNILVHNKINKTPKAKRGRLRNNLFCFSFSHELFWGILRVNRSLTPYRTIHDPSLRSVCPSLGLYTHSQCPYTHHQGLNYTHHQGQSSYHRVCKTYRFSVGLRLLQEV